MAHHQPRRPPHRFWRLTQCRTDQHFLTLAAASSLNPFHPTAVSFNVWGISGNVVSVMHVGISILLVTDTEQFAIRNDARGLATASLTQFAIVLGAVLMRYRCCSAIAFNSCILSSEPLNCSPDAINCNKLSFSNNKDTTQHLPLVKVGLPNRILPSLSLCLGSFGITFCQKLPPQCQIIVQPQLRIPPIIVLFY